MELVQLSSKLTELEEGAHVQVEQDDGEDNFEVRKQGSKKRKSSDLRQSFDDIPKEVNKFQGIMQAQVDLQNPKVQLPTRSSPSLKKRASYLTMCGIV